jgi:DNA-directed RNA polymerase subunit RPC12/RpoP
MREIPMWAASLGLPDGYAKCPHCRWVLRITAKQVNEYIWTMAHGKHVHCETCGYWVLVVAFIEMKPIELKGPQNNRATMGKKEEKDEH